MIVMGCISPIVRWAMRLAWPAAKVIFVLAIGWMVGLPYLIYRIVRAVRYVRRLRRALAPTTQCEKGHVVTQYGLFVCADCKAQTESWVWRCPFCEALHGWTACPHPTCDLSVRNGFLAR